MEGTLRAPHRRATLLGAVGASLGMVFAGGYALSHPSLLSWAAFALLATLGGLVLWVTWSVLRHRIWVEQDVLHVCEFGRGPARVALTGEAGIRLTGPPAPGLAPAWQAFVYPDAQHPDPAGGVVLDPATARLSDLTRLLAPYRHLAVDPFTRAILADVVDSAEAAVRPDLPEPLRRAA